jgi:hypothetical protein
MENILTRNTLSEETRLAQSFPSLINGVRGMSGPNATQHVAVELEVECVFALARIVLDPTSNRKNATYNLV